MSLKAFVIGTAIATSLLAGAGFGAAQASSVSWSADQIGEDFEQSLSLSAGGAATDIPIELAHVSQNGNAWTFKAFSGTLPTDTIIYAFGSGSAAQQVSTVSFGRQIINSHRGEHLGARDDCALSGVCFGRFSADGDEVGGLTRMRVVFTYPVTAVTLSDLFSRYGQQNAPTPPVTPPSPDYGGNGGYDYSYDTGSGDNPYGDDYSGGSGSDPGSSGAPQGEIIPFAPGAPEPAVWMLMITSVGGIGSALRFNRRQRVVTCLLYTSDAADE